MQWVFDEIFFRCLISHLPGPRVCRFKNTGTNAVRTTLRLVLLMKNDSHFRFLTSLRTAIPPPFRNTNAPRRQRSGPGPASLPTCISNSPGGAAGKRRSHRKNSDSRSCFDHAAHRPICMLLDCLIPTQIVPIFIIDPSS